MTNIRPEHWIALYLDADGRGDYLCSYGLPPRHVASRTFMNDHCSEWTHNSKILQSPLSNVCGQYCVAYVLLRCNGFPMRTFINIFGTNLVANDCRVFDWLKELQQGRLLSYIVHRFSLWRGGSIPELTTSGVIVNIRKSPHHHPRASGEVETP